ncbi:hypothetical protein HYW44_03730 [Candidatus Daviesbacteria bacterium]|nr:hypothetical protein [Candidatus Daviesbacteria bacterium]
MALLDYLSKILPSKRKENPSEYYFGLDIRHGFVIGSVWGIEGEKVKIISLVHRNFHPAENFPENAHSLVEAANIALDEALADFQPEPEKILFGVPDSWLADEELKPNYSKVLKQLVRELDIIPLAYVSTTHAICHLRERQEGVPTTAILVEIADPLSVAVVKAGKVLGSKEIARSESLPRDIEKGLLSFPDIEVLPAKILIFGKGKMSHLKEELVSFNWMGQLPFLHLPKIEELEEDVSIKSLSFAGASEINPHVHLEHHTIPISPKQTKTHTAPQTQETAFVQGDIEDQYAGTAVDTYEKNVQPQSVGNVLDKLSPAGIIPKRMPNLMKWLRGLGFTLVIPVIIVIVLILAYLFLPKATVTVYVDPKILEKETQIVADPKITTTDEANKQIAGKIVEISVNGTSKAGATGKKQIGDPAKGAVIIYNKTQSSKTFPQGTVLVGQNNLNFALDTSITVASQSAVEGGISFGKSTGNATALTIGPDGNLAAGKELTIKGSSPNDFNAKVDSAFSGGVSKDVTVVTSDDQKKLLASLTGDLKKKAQEEIQGKLTGDMKILEETFVEKVLKQSFSKNAGDQASEFSLTLNLSLKGTAYSDSDLKSIVGKLVETTVPEGFELDLSRTETQATVAKVEKDGKIIFTAKFKAKLMPKMDLEKIKSEIKFKKPDMVEAILKSNESVIGADIKIKPELPGPLQRLPLLPQNINLEISSN